MRTLYGKRWYKPREIAELGLILNSKGNKDPNFIYELIKSGRLLAKDYSTSPKVHYWLVPENEIERYHQVITPVEVTENAGEAS